MRYVAGAIDIVVAVGQKVIALDKALECAGRWTATVRLVSADVVAADRGASSWTFESW